MSVSAVKTFVNLSIIFAVLCSGTAQAEETVFKCKNGNNFTYQNVPCAKNAEINKLVIPAFKPDPVTLERLERQRMEYLQENNPEEYHRIKRQHMTQDERIADENLKREELQRKNQQIQAQQQLRLQREILLRQHQIEQKLARQRQLEQQLLEQQQNNYPQWQYWPPPQYSWPPRQIPPSIPYQPFERPLQNRAPFIFPLPQKH